MFKKVFCSCMFVVWALLFASCTAKQDPKEDVPAKGLAVETPVKKEMPLAKADLREVTLHVEGMSERLNLV